MARLEGREWKPFELNAIMESSNSRPYHSASLNFDNNEGIPYITRTAKDNGVFGFVKDDGELKTNPQDTISFGAETAEFFYQPTPYVTGNKMYYLEEAHMDIFTGLFIATCLYKNIKDCFSYSNGAIPERVMRKSIMLPVTDSGDPDWDYMAAIVKQIKEQKAKQYKEYVKKQLADLEYKDIPALNKIEWEPFLISEIFDILPGKRLVAAHSSEGSRPFIGALDNNNGVARFVSDTNSSLDKNVLGVNYNGNGMVIGFYHPYECIFSDDVKRFHLKNYADGKFVLLFMKVAILMQKKKFGYLYKFNADRMAHTHIMLPVGDDGQPDYGYMEQYSKNLMLRKYEQYLAFTEKKS